MMFGPAAQRAQLDGDHPQDTNGPCTAQHERIDLQRRLSRLPTGH